MKKIILISVIAIIVLVGGYFLLKGLYQAPVPTAPAPTTPTEELTPAPEELTPAPEELTPAPEELTPGPEELTPAPEELTPGPEETTVPPAIKEFTISGTEFRFKPSSIIVSPGERVKIIFRNDGMARHDFVIKDLGIRTRVIGPGETDTIEFTAPASGTYTFICSVPGHAAAGMVGDLIVE